MLPQMSDSYFYAVVADADPCNYTPNDPDDKPEVGRKTM